MCNFIYLRFAGEDLVIFQELELVTDQQDWRAKFVAGHTAILAGHCPLTGSYFEPCKSSWKLLSSFIRSKNTRFAVLSLEFLHEIKALHSAFKVYGIYHQWEVNLLNNHVSTVRALAWTAAVLICLLMRLVNLIVSSLCHRQGLACDWRMAHSVPRSSNHLWRHH